MSVNKSVEMSSDSNSELVLVFWGVYFFIL